MTTITLRSAIGRPLTNDEVDANFINLNTDKLEVSALGSSVQPYDADLAAIASLTGTTGLLRKTRTNTWSLDTTAYLIENQTVTLTGDATGLGKTSITVTLNTVSASKGGTGRTSLSSNAILLGNGTGAVNFVQPGTSGNLLVSNGTTWTSIIPTGQGFSRSINIYNAVDQSAIDDSTPAGLYLWATDPNNTRYSTQKFISIKSPSPSSLSTSYSLVLPTSDGSPKQLLSTDGAGNLSWVDRPTRAKAYFYSSF